MTCSWRFCGKANVKLSPPHWNRSLLRNNKFHGKNRKINFFQWNDAKLILSNPKNFVSFYGTVHRYYTLACIATSALRIQSSEKHCTSVNYCWKLFWSQFESYILAWLHGLGFILLITYLQYFFFLSFWLPLISMQSHERCEFMRRKSSDDNACVLVSECASFYFIFLVEDKKDSLEQIFSHKSSIAECSLVLFLLRSTNRTRQINAFERCTPPSHTHSQPASQRSGITLIFMKIKIEPMHFWHFILCVFCNIRNRFGKFLNANFDEFSFAFWKVCEWKLIE